MAPRDLSLLLLLFAVVLFVVASYSTRARLILSSVAFFLLVTEGLAFFSNWAPPQARLEPPPQIVQLRQRPAEELTTAELAYWGEVIIFGRAGALHGQGKGQCPLCHGFKPGDVSERAPNLMGISRRAAERIKETRYLNPDTVQTESFPGSGRARTADEYIAESHICPNCYVAEGYGVKGSNDRESPMASDHLPPIGLNIDEMIAVHTFLFVHDGETPPSPAQIRANHQRFLPSWWQAADGSTASRVPAPRPVIMTGAETPQNMIAKLGCGDCHTAHRTVGLRGAVGPALAAATLASRLASAEYQERVLAGAARATTPKEYVIESILSPSAYVLAPFADSCFPGISPMPTYSDKLTYEATEKLADFLLSIDEGCGQRGHCE